MKSSRKKFRSVVGSGDTVGGISVGVSVGIVEGTAVGLNTISGVGLLSVEREVKLQAGTRITKTIGQNFRILKFDVINAALFYFTPTILKELQISFPFGCKASPAHYLCGAGH